MISFFTSLWTSLWTTLALAAIGGVIGIISYFAGRFASWWVSALVGAVLVVGAYGSGQLSQFAADSSKTQIAQLEADKAKLEHDLAAINEVRAFELKQFEDFASKTKVMEEKYQNALDVIDKHKDDKDCGLSKEELDAIIDIK